MSTDDLGELRLLHPSWSIWQSDGGSHPGYYATRHISGASIGDATATLSADSVRDLRALLNSSELENSTVLEEVQ